MELAQDARMLTTAFRQHPTPTPQPPTKLLLCPRNYTGMQHVSHTGLAVSAMNTAKVLRREGINVLVIPVKDAMDLEATVLREAPTHVVVNALWVPTASLTTLVHKYPHIHWAVLVHSNIAFLQVEPNGIRLLHEAVDLETASAGNFNVAANSRNGAQGLRDAWGAPATYLPNLYALEGPAPHRPHWSGRLLKIGAFGAMRPLKNPSGSAFAALAIARHLGAALEFHVNVGRNDGGWASNLLAAVRAIFRGLPNATLVEDPWTDWTTFRRLIGSMDLLLQPSFTESFNVVTADGVSQGVASVVSDVIEWAPNHWKAAPDNTEEIARVGRLLVGDHHAASDGFRALQQHNKDGIGQWESFLSRKVV